MIISIFINVLIIHETNWQETPQKPKSKNSKIDATTSKMLRDQWLSFQDVHTFLVGYMYCFAS